MQPNFNPNQPMPEGFNGVPAGTPPVPPQPQPTPMSEQPMQPTPEMTTPVQPAPVSPAPMGAGAATVAKAGMSGFAKFLIAFLTIAIVAGAGVGVYFGFFHDKATGGEPAGGQVSGAATIEGAIEVVNYENYNVKINLDMTMYGMETTSVSEGVVDEKNQREYLKMTTEAMGMPIETEIYYDFTTGISYTSVPYIGGWTMSEDDGDRPLGLAEIRDKILGLDDVTKVSDGHFKVKMSAEDAQGLTSTADDTTYTGEVEVDVYIAGGHITKLEYDMSEIAQEMGIESIKASIEFSNYNTAGSVEIPASVINSAE